ncbi:MAG TPA: DUF1800 domain-containing protein [Terracidiphilus sp.]|nr:DUF1800 domain-containing protein [Terracidiphilus sp.]
MRDRHARNPLPQLMLMAACLWCSLSLLTGCSGYSVTDPSYYAAITSPASSIRVTQQMQIGNNAKITGIPLTYYVNGIQGGNAEVGTIDATGLYTAPAVVPVPNTVTITSDTGNAKYPPGSLTLAVLNPIPVINTVTPTAFAEGTELVTVAGSQFVYGAQILWNGTAVPTTYISGTQLAAEIAAPNAGTYPLTVANPDPGSANAKTVPVVVSAGQVQLTLQTPAGSDVRVRNTLGFSVMVTGTNNTAVNVMINGIAGGNAQLGTVVANADGSITYTAPPVVPSPNVVQLSIVSVDNPTVSLNHNIAVLNPIPILNTASPDTMNVAATTVVLTGSDFINGATVLMNGASMPTTFNSGTQLTATITPTQPGNVDLQVLNPSPGPATSADLIADVQGTVPVPPVSFEDASRFLDQATFGATDSDIQHLSQIGYSAWLNEQFNMPQTMAEPAVEQALILNNPACAAGDLKCNAALFVQNNQSDVYLENQFWQQSLTASDQLRQRVAYALLSQYVISESTPQVENMPRGEANYYDLLGKDAFGNFRTLLEDVTLNPVMGNFLSMLGNDKGNATTDPDENYAREVMQLFTIGLWQLNDDARQQLDGNGQPIPTYSNTDVQGLAKVFTGFSWQVPGDTSDAAWSNCCEYVGTGFGEDLLPMTAYPSHHSTAEKDFLGVTIPASGSPDPTGDLKIALDTLFNHPNVPPFVCKQLIQHLVTSNPSPGYISRVAAVFENNGSGVRGDMKAVITAILTDPEARNAAADLANPQYGKVREALLRYTEWARAFTAQSRNGFYNLGSTEDPIWGLGQMPFRSPTVFNWFAPNYVPPGTSIEAAGLEGPEFQMTNVTTVVGYLNYMQDAIGSDATGGSDIYANYGTEMGLAATPDALMDRINLLLMAGEMSSTLRAEIEGAVEAIPIPTGDQDAINAALKARVQTAIYLTIASPDFAAQY